MDLRPTIVTLKEAEDRLRADQLIFFLGETPLSRAQLQVLIREGRLTRDGTSLRASTRVRAGEVLTLDFKAPPEPLASHTLPLDIIYEDADLLAINKPAHLIVHPTPETLSRITLVHGLLAHAGHLSSIGAPLRPGIVHRLDRGTTGVLLVAKTDFAHRHLAQQFANREVEKMYFALAHGVPSPKAGIIESRMARHPRHRQRFASTEGEGKWAKTQYKILATRDRLSLLEIDLFTGRTHQIRVHLAELGHAIVADTLYGRRQKTMKWPRWASSLAQLTHQALHAAQLKVLHPRHKTPLELRAPLPESWASVAELVKTAPSRA